MKIIVFKLLSISILALLASCSNSNTKEPEQIGKQAFEILKTLNTTNKGDYVVNFLSAEEIREIGKNKDLVRSERTRNELTSIRKEEWTGRIERYFNDIKEKGGRYGINWKEVEYLDFVYELEDEDGIKVCDGSLFFKYDEKSYRVKTSAIFNGKRYKLAHIKSLRN